MSTETDGVDELRQRHGDLARELAVFRYFVYQVADDAEDAGLREAAEDAAEKINSLDHRLRILELEVGKEPAQGAGGDA